MSKLKFKFKKTIKLAEFVHADLEYHEELSTDIIVSFKEEIKRLISLLPEEPQKIWKSDRYVTLPLCIGIRQPPRISGT